MPSVAKALESLGQTRFQLGGQVEGIKICGGTVEAQWFAGEKLLWPSRVGASHGRDDVQMRLGGLRQRRYLGVVMSRSKRMGSSTKKRVRAGFGWCTMTSG